MTPITQEQVRTTSASQPHKWTKAEIEATKERYDEVRREQREEILAGVEERLNRLNVYYRSKFSIDCSAGENEEEMQTEMIEREKVFAVLADVRKLLGKEEV